MNTEDTELLQSDVDNLIGTTFAESYEILSVLGKGGISVVYKARYVPLDQLVAVKVLQAHLAANPTVLQRLRMEAKLAHSIEHANIVRVLRLHIDEGGFPFLVCDLVDGKTLQAVLAEEGPLIESRFFHILDQIMSALEHAHKQGVVHRDIKPSNIMITTEGEQNDIVKVVDFGIAKLLEDSAAANSNNSMSSTGNVIGSPSYMSPEQCTGIQTDARTDIYSLGCLMYEALTGVPAFSGDTTFDTMRQQLETPPRSLREVAPQSNISPALESAVMAALQKDPAQRPQSIADLRKLLQVDNTYKLHIMPPTFRRDMPPKSGIISAVAGLAVVTAAAGAVYLHSVYQQPAATTGGELPHSDPKVDPRQYETANGALQMAGFLKKHERHEEALQVYLRANELLTPELAKAPPSTILEIKQNIGDLYAAKHLHQNAYPFRVQAVEVAKSMDKLDYGISLSRLSESLAGCGRLENALQEAQKATDILENEFKKTGELKLYKRRRSHACAHAWGQRAKCYQALQRYGDEEKALSRRRDHCQKSMDLAMSPRQLEQDTLALMGALRDLAINCQNQGRTDDAVKIMRQWLENEQGLPRLDGHAPSVEAAFERNKGHLLLTNLLAATPAKTKP